MMQDLVQYVKNHLWVRNLCLLLGNVFFVLLVCALVPICFEDNDDVTSAWIVSGVYTGTPDGHLVFINAMYGYFVAGLYEILPIIEWYSILFVLIHIVSFTIILNEEITYLSVKSLRIGTIILTYILFFMVLVRLQFTTVASIAAFAGILLLLRKKWLGGGIMLVLGSLIRFEAAGMMGLLMCPMFLFHYKKDIWKSYCPLIGILLIVLTLHLADNIFYQSDEWKSFMECNRYLTRGNIEDNPNVWRIYNQIPPGISKTNYCLTVSYCHDPKVVSVKDLQAIATSLKNVPLKKKIWNIVKPIKNYWYWFISVGIISLILLYYGNKRVKVYNMACMLLWICIICVISLNASLKYRVFISGTLPILYMLIYFGKDIFPKSKAVQSIVCVSMLVWGLNWIIPAYGHIKHIVHSQNIMQEQLKLYAQRGCRKIVSDGPDFHVELFPAFKLRTTLIPQTFINPYCFAGSPLNPDYMSHKDFIDKKLCLFSKKPYDVDLRLKALKENYDIDAEVVTIAESEHYVLLKFIKNEQDVKP